MGPEASQEGGPQRLASFNEGSGFLGHGGLLTARAKPGPQPQGQLLLVMKADSLVKRSR